MWLTIKRRDQWNAMRDGRFMLDQINLKRSRKRLVDEMDAAVCRSRPWDMICVSDPPPSLLDDAKAWLADYYLAWDYKKSAGDDSPPELKRVATFIHRSIPTKDVDTIQIDDENVNSVATLIVRTPIGAVAIHNFYNRHGARGQLERFTQDGRLVENTDIFNVTALTRRFLGRGIDVVIGDSNLPYIEWNGPSSRKPHCALAEEFAHAMRAHGLALLTTPGAVTYSRGLQGGGRYESTIDLIFGGRVIQSRFRRWRIADEVLGFESDHRNCETTLDIDLPGRRRYVPRTQIDEITAVTATEEALAGHEIPKPRTRSDADQ